MTDPIPARLAALKTMPMPDLKAEWRRLFETEPPPFNRRYLENRIAYRIQELAYGGLKPETLRRLEALGEIYDSDNVTTRRIRHDAKPVAGTRLLREYRGVEHAVTVCKCRMKSPQKCRTKIPHFRELGSVGIRHGRLHFSVGDRVVLAAAVV